MDDNAEVEEVPELEMVSVKELADKYRETAEIFRHASRQILGNFLAIEDQLKGSVNALVELADMLDPPEPTNKTEGE